MLRKLVRVYDLIGKEIAGRKADIASRNANGELRYGIERHYSTLVEMLRVHITTEDGRKWLRWEWDGKGLQQPMACGLSGIALTGKYVHDEAAQLERAKGYYILIEEGPTDAQNGSAR